MATFEKEKDASIVIMHEKQNKTKCSKKYFVSHKR